MACALSSVVLAIPPMVVARVPSTSGISSSSSSSPSAVAHRVSSTFGVGAVRNTSGFSTPLDRRTEEIATCRSSRVIAKAAAESGETALAETEWGAPVQLATGKIPDDVDLKLFETLLYQWGASLTQNANLPLPVPLKVDRIAGGVRLGYVEVINATVKEVCHIDVIVCPKSEDQPKAMMRALRNGKLKDLTPPAEPLIMQSLLQALKTAVARARA